MAIRITITGGSYTEIGIAAKCIQDYFRFQIEEDGGTLTEPEQGQEWWHTGTLLKKRIMQVKVIVFGRDKKCGWGPLLRMVQDGKRFDPPRVKRPDVDTLAVRLWQRILHETDSDEEAVREIAKLLMTERGIFELERKQLLALIPPTCGGGLKTEA